MSIYPLVSVNITTYNRARYIREAIDSVLAQTFKPLEIFVIDDGSTDNTKELLRDYGDRIKYIYQKNQGVAVARNVGVDRSQGDYIAFLDSDDLWLPERLEKQIQYIQAHPEMAFISGEVYIIDANGQVLRHARLHSDTQPTFEDLFEYTFIHFSTTLVNKKRFNEFGGFDPQFRSSQDYDLWLRMSKKYPFDCLRMPLAKYREHPDRISVQLDTKLKNNLIIFHKTEIIGDLGRRERIVRIARVYYQYAQLNFEQKKYSKAAMCYLKALLFDPFIGRYYWPEETRRMRFSLPYRVMKVYFLVLKCLFRELGNSLPVSASEKASPASR